MEILHDCSHEIAAALGDFDCIIEPGAGSCSKVQRLLDDLPQLRSYIPMDISTAALDRAVTELEQRFPKLEVRAVAGDFTDNNCLHNIANQQHIGQRRLVFFPGSTIGNFTARESLGVLRWLRELAGDNGAVLLGADLIKSRDRLLAAYNDAEGVTAEFNKNILRRINRELAGDFNVDDGFAHRAVFSEQHCRVEMQLVARRAQSVTIGGEILQFHRGEHIHTENSHKYSKQLIAQLSSSAGLTVAQHWQDSRGDFALFLLSAD